MNNFKTAYDSLISIVCFLVFVIFFIIGFIDGFFTSDNN